MKIHYTQSGAINIEKTTNDIVNMYCRYQAKDSVTMKSIDSILENVLHAVWADAYTLGYTLGWSDGKANFDRIERENPYVIKEEAKP